MIINNPKQQNPRPLTEDDKRKIDNARDTIRQAEHEVQRREIVKSAQGIIAEIKPSLDNLASEIKNSKQDVKDLVSAKPIERIIEKTIGEIKIPEIKIPKIDVKVPEIKVPEVKMPKKIDVGLKNITKENPLPVILIDEKGKSYKAWMEAVMSGGGGMRYVEVVKPENVAHYTVNMALADTEYSQSLPQGTVAMTFQCRGTYDIRFSYNSGKVATPVESYMTLKAGMIYYETNLKMANKTIYFACANAGQNVEIIAYY